MEAPEQYYGSKKNATIPFWAKYMDAKSDQAVYTNMVADAKKQAGLEEAWMSAWYYQQFWAKMSSQLTKTTLTTTGVNSRAKDFNDWELAAGGAGFSDAFDTSRKGSTANQTANNTKLENARYKLAFLNPAKAAATTAQTLVETQILNTTEQIADFTAQLVVGTGAGDTRKPGGELTEVAFMRKEDYDVYGKATTGLKAVNAKAKTDAEAAVKAGTKKTDSSGV